MMHYFSLHIESARNAIKYFCKQPLTTLLILIMLAIAMTLPLALYLGVQSSQTVIGKLNEAPQITLYMELNADDVDNQAVKSLLEQDTRVEKSDFVSKQSGLEELQKSMGDQDLVSMLDSNPLPDVFIVTPKENMRPSEINSLKQDLSQLPMVASAKLDTEWMQTLYQINSFVHHIFWFLAITLSVAFILVAHNTIRLQILNRREEIEITKLLGAPSSFIRRPFLYQATWESILSAIISLGLCAYLMYVSQPVVNQIFKPYGINLNWRFFYWWEVLLVLIIVILLGILGAWLATQQYLSSLKARK